MSISYENEQYAYHLTYNSARVFGNHDQAHRWACYARDSWRISNAIKRGYSIGSKFLKLANIYFYEEDIHKVLVREGIEPEEDHDQIPPGPPHAQIPPPHGQIPPGPGQIPHGQAPPNLSNGTQVQNMGKDDDDDDEDDEDIRKKLEDQ